MQNKREVEFIVIRREAIPQGTTTESVKRCCHYLIKRNGEITKLNPESGNTEDSGTSNSEAIYIGYMAGNYKTIKNNVPNRHQEISLFNKVVELTERHPNAKVIDDEIFSNAEVPPLFNVHHWLANYLPEL